MMLRLTQCLLVQIPQFVELLVRDASALGARGSVVDLECGAMFAIVRVQRSSACVLPLQ